MSKAHRSLPASYVVRLYRADPVRPDALAGLIEDLARGETRSFRTGTELLRQLADTGGDGAAQDGADRQHDRAPDAGADDERGQS